MRLALLLPLFLIGCCSQPTQGTADQASFAAAARAIDGDTLSVDFRLLGLDAPEKRPLCANDQGWWPCGKAAQDYLARALRDQEVRITLASGRTYRRRVATVEVSGVDLGERLIAAGLAVPAVQYLKSDPDRATRYQRAFATAKKAEAGMHAGRWIEPAKWRRGERLSCEARVSRRGKGPDTRTGPA